MALRIEDYWIEPPPEPSSSLLKWLSKIDAGWRPNRRISQMGYYTRAEFFKVYLWEYLNVIFPKLQAIEEAESTEHALSE